MCYSIVSQEYNQAELNWTLLKIETIELLILKKVNNCCNTKNTFYLVTSGGQIFNPYLRDVPFTHAT